MIWYIQYTLSHNTAAAAAAAAAVRT